MTWIIATHQAIIFMSKIELVGSTKGKQRLNGNLSCVNLISNVNTMDTDMETNIIANKNLKIDFVVLNLTLNGLTTIMSLDKERKSNMRGATTLNQRDKPNAVKHKKLDLQYLS